MNRATRLSLIAVMLLATTALGTIGYKTMYPDLPPAAAPAPEPVKEAQPPKPPEPKPNPYYEKLKADLERHERHCLELGRPIIVLDAKNRAQVEQQARECWNAVKIEREYVTNFPAKTI